MSDARIEAHQPAVVDAVTRFGRLTVNGVAFAVVDGLVLSAPVTPKQIETFYGVGGYSLRDAEPPYTLRGDLGEGRVNLDTLKVAPGADADGAALEDKGLGELRALADERGLEYPKNTTKAKLIELLTQGGAS